MKKGIRLDFCLRECNGVPTKLWDFNHQYQGITVAVPT